MKTDLTTKLIKRKLQFCEKNRTTYTVIYHINQRANSQALTVNPVKALLKPRLWVIGFALFVSHATLKTFKLCCSDSNRLSLITTKLMDKADMPRV